MSGLTVCFEGPDLVGKTTLCAATRFYFECKFPDDKEKVVVVRNPGATPLGEKLRQLLKHDLDIKLDGNTERILFLADNSAFIHQIMIPVLQENKILIMDRCNFVSDIPYGLAFGVDLNFILELHNILEAPKIDYLFLLRCPFNQLLIRQQQSIDRQKCKIEGRGKKYLRKVNEAYNGRATRQEINKRCKQIIEINASKPAESVWVDVRKVLDTIIL